MAHYQLHTHTCLYIHTHKPRAQVSGSQAANEDISYSWQPLMALWFLCCSLALLRGSSRWEQGQSGQHKQTNTLSQSVWTTKAYFTVREHSVELFLFCSVLRNDWNKHVMIMQCSLVDQAKWGGKRDLIQRWATKTKKPTHTQDITQLKCSNESIK